MPPYQEKYQVGSQVQIVDAAELQQFLETWKYHHKLTEEQLNLAGHIARVRKIGFYHGGDVIYELDGIPGIWHEQCLSSSTNNPDVTPIIPYAAANFKTSQSQFGEFSRILSVVLLTALCFFAILEIILLPGNFRALLREVRMGDKMERLEIVYLEAILFVTSILLLLAIPWTSWLISRGPELSFSDYFRWLRRLLILILCISVIEFAVMVACS